MSPGETKPSACPTRRGFGALAAGGILALTGESAGSGEPGKAASVEDALLAMVRARYGKHLTAEQLEALGRSLKRGLTRADEMQRVPLTNADEPAVAFRADLP